MEGATLTHMETAARMSPVETVFRKPAVSHFSDLRSEEEEIEYLGGHCRPKVLTLASLHNLPWGVPLTRVKQEKVEVHQDQEGSARSRSSEATEATHLGSAACRATKATEAVLPLAEGIWDNMDR